jgi:hypothetical protein
MSLDTTNWAQFPFSVDGVDFVSLLDPNGSYYPQIVKMPTQMITLMNTECIREVIGNPTQFTVEELQDELDRVNEGATQAILALA